MFFTGSPVAGQAKRGIDWLPLCKFYVVTFRLRLSGFLCQFLRLNQVTGKRSIAQIQKGS